MYPFSNAWITHANEDDNHDDDDDDENVYDGDFSDKNNERKVTEMLLN